jgi:hypothetical protein
LASELATQAEDAVAQLLALLVVQDQLVGETVLEAVEEITTTLIGVWSLGGERIAGRRYPVLDHEVSSRGPGSGCW